MPLTFIYPLVYCLVLYHHCNSDKLRRSWLKVSRACFNGTNEGITSEQIYSFFQISDRITFLLHYGTISFFFFILPILWAFFWRPRSIRRGPEALCDLLWSAMKADQYLRSCRKVWPWGQTFDYWFLIKVKVGNDKFCQRYFIAFIGMCETYHSGPSIQVEKI